MQTRLLNKLTPHQFEMFKRTVFGKGDSLSFCVGGKIVTFPKVDFLLMNNWWRSSTQVDRDEESSLGLQIKYFLKQSTTTPFHIDSVEESIRIWSLKNDDDIIKVTLV